MTVLYKHNKHWLIAGFLSVALFSCNLFAQKAEPETELKFLKNSDNSRTITYSVKYTPPEGKKALPAVGIPVTFTTGVEGEKLATVKTNGHGVALFTVAGDKQLPASEGKYTFTANIDENPLVESKNDAITMQDLEIELTFEVVDSIKTIYYKVYELTPGGEKKPAQADLVFYVPRTFSKLKVGESSANEEGSGEIEFPEGLPGDSLGILTVIAMVEENDTYATVEKRQSIAWGVPTNYHIAKFQRALWTTIAPTWMIVTLTILLLGVWGHYIFAVYKLYQIKKESRTA